MLENERITITYIPVDLIDIEDQPMPKPSPDEHEMLKQNILNRGIRWPIEVVLKSTGRYKVIDGRSRLKAVIELNHTEIPCIVRDTKDEHKSLSLAYDSELFRRRLSDKDYKKLLEERHRLWEKRIWTQQAFDNCLQRIIPELHKDIKQLFEKTKDPDTVIHLSLIPEHLQKDFYRATYSITREREAEQKLTEALQGQEEYELKRNNLVHKVKKLKKVKQEYKELIEQHKVNPSLKKKEIKKKGGKIREQHQIEIPQQVIKDYQEKLNKVEKKTRPSKKYR